MSKKERMFIFLLAVLKFVLPFLWQHPAFELHRDEYLYFEQGRHLDWGYLENPPMIGILAFIASLLGGSFFWIKWWPSLFGALTFIVTAGLIKELGGKTFAVFIAFFGMLLTVYLRVHFLFQPTMLDVFFCTLSIYYLLRFINTQQPLYLYLLSIALALGWWGKYSVLFFITSIVLSILLTHHRKMLSNKHFWWALLLGFVLIVPNIIWQYFHHWPLLHHMEELRATQLQYISKTDFIKDQFILLLPVVFVWIGGLVWLLQHTRYRIVAFIYFIMVLLILFGSGKGYYTLGAYPMLLAAGGVWLEQLSLQRKKLRYVFTGLILLIAFPGIPLLIPLQSPEAMALANEKWGIEKMGLLKWEDQQNHPLQQDFADMQGWKELAVKAERLYYSLPGNKKKNTLVYCRNYGQAGALKYYAKQNEFREKVICDNGTFLLWIPRNLYFNHLIFVGRNMPEKDDAVFQQFADVTVIDSVTNPLSRQYGDKIIFFENATDSARILANAGLKEMKAAFGE